MSDDEGVEPISLGSNYRVERIPGPSGAIIRKTALLPARYPALPRWEFDVLRILSEAGWRWCPRPVEMSADGLSYTMSDLTSPPESATPLPGGALTGGQRLRDGVRLAASFHALSCFDHREIARRPHGPFSHAYVRSRFRGAPPREAQRLTDRHWELRSIVMHGDLSAKNMMRGAAGFYLLDMETVQIGTREFDLAYLLADIALSTHWPRWLRDRGASVLAEYEGHTGVPLDRELVMRSAVAIVTTKAAGVGAAKNVALVGHPVGAPHAAD